MDRISKLQMIAPGTTSIETRQEKVGSKEEERTVIEVTQLA